MSYFARASKVLRYHHALPAHSRPAAALAHPLQLPLRRSSSATPTVQPPDYLSDGERRIFAKLQSALEPVKLEVQDVSGGCGSMYGLDIVSPKFEGLSIIKQHQLVNKILADELKEWHGMQLKTKAP